jgi:hypothetical protein
MMSSCFGSMVLVGTSLDLTRTYFYNNWLEAVGTFSLA